MANDNDCLSEMILQLSNKDAMLVKEIVRRLISRPVKDDKPPTKEFSFDGFLHFSDSEDDLGT